jgi:hypothetical protein
VYPGRLGDPLVKAPVGDIRALLHAHTSIAEEENGLHAQVDRLVGEAELRGWEYEELILEHASGRTLARRPELRRALGCLERHEADVLTVTRLELLARSTADIGHLLERARRRGWELVGTLLGTRVEYLAEALEFTLRFQGGLDEALRRDLHIAERCSPTYGPKPCVSLRADWVQGFRAPGCVGLAVDCGATAAPDPKQQ